MSGRVLVLHTGGTIGMARGADGYRAYLEYLPAGRSVLRYRVRLNNAGSFALPPTRVDAMYAPAVFGASPNEPLTVLP